MAFIELGFSKSIGPQSVPIQLKKFSRVLVHKLIAESLSISALCSALSGFRYAVTAGPELATP